MWDRWAGVIEDRPEVLRLIDLALAEDRAFDDVTADALLARDVSGRGTIRAKDHGILAGMRVALKVFHRVGGVVRTEVLMTDGQPLKPGDAIIKLSGSASSILRGERTALNFLQRMSGIATETSRLVEAVAGYKARIVDTRKTAPGLRRLDKHAVRVGGGFNHRMGLADGILIKDNHISVMRRKGKSLAAIIRMAAANAPHTLKIEVEVDSLAQVKEALSGGAHIIMLDDMSLDEMREAVELVGGRALVEASGGVTLASVAAVAATGVDLISVGALTHSVKALDINLDLVT